MSNKVCFEIMGITKLLKRYLDNSTDIKYAEKYTGNNIWILSYLFCNTDRDIFQKDIEEAFSIRRSTVSKAIKLMAQKGLIKQEPVDYDARLKKLVPTEKAVQINEVITKQIEEVENKFTSGLTEKEIYDLTEILQKIRKNFEADS